MSQTRERLLDHAEQLLLRGGAGAGSFRELAKATGLKSASVHYHFPTKDHLIAAVVQRYSAVMMDTLGRPDDRDEAPRDRVSRLTDIYIARLTEEGGCLCAVLSAAPDALGPMGQDALQTHYQDLVRWTAAALGTPDDTARAAGVIARLQGALALAGTLGMPEVLEHAEAEILSGL